MEMDSRWASAILRLTERDRHTMSQPGEGFPHFADSSTGEWVRSVDGDWTGGFWPGQLWLLANAYQTDSWRPSALTWARRLRPRAASESIFRGFLFWYGAGLGASLLHGEEAAEIAQAGAAGLATLFNPSAGLIPLGRQAEEAANVGLATANIDGVPGTVPLLVWSARSTGRHDLEGIARAHAARHQELCVRSDGSVCQSADFDPVTGDLKRRFTHKGSSDTSTWTRAQAWAMLGFAHASIWLGDEFLPVLQKVSDWWIDHLPPDGVAFWDFDVEPSPTEFRDTSGTAIAAAALLKLAALVPHNPRYRACAEQMIEHLIRDFLTPVDVDDHRPAGILTNGCYNRRIGLAVDNELVWGDYFLLEALLVLDKRLDPLAV